MIQLSHAARRRKIEARIEDATLVRLYRRMSLRAQGFRCLYCFGPLSFESVTGDHLKPRAVGGKTTYDNVKASCLRCNRVKADMDWRVFLPAILNPQLCHGVDIWLIAAERKIWSRTWAACERIAAQVGIDAVPSVIAAVERKAA